MGVYQRHSTGDLDARRTEVYRLLTSGTDMTCRTVGKKLGVSAMTVSRDWNAVCEQFTAEDRKAIRTLADEDFAEVIEQVREEIDTRRGAEADIAPLVNSFVAAWNARLRIWGIPEKAKPEQPAGEAILDLELQQLIDEGRTQMDQFEHDLRATDDEGD